MSLGGNVLRQHVVEFIRGTGVVTDGITDATSTNGPWNWTVHDGVVEIFVDGCAGGESGGAGAYQAAALSAGGGAGGCAGTHVMNQRMVVLPNSQLQITLGAGGTGSASSDGASSSGGDTTITGLLPGVMNFSGTFILRGGDAYIGAPPTSATTAIATRGQGQSTDGASGTGGSVSPPILVSGITRYTTPSQGGGGAASGAVGLQGGFSPFSYSEASATTRGVNWFTRSNGTSSGGGSWGGGGRGFPSQFSYSSPAGGNGDAIGSDAAASDYGAGGGGGGGSGTARRRGGNGGSGYVRIVYWSAD